MSYTKVTKGNLIDQYLDDLDLFVNTNGEQGALSYVYYYCYNRIGRHTWKDFMIDIVYEQDIILSLNKLIQEPTQENADAFKHECRCYAVSTYMDDVVEHLWGYVDKSEKRED